MVSVFSALMPAINTIKNTIDDADYIINWIIIILIFLDVRNFCHSHSIINKQFLLLFTIGYFPTKR